MEIRKAQSNPDDKQPTSASIYWNTDCQAQIKILDLEVGNLLKRQLVIAILITLFTTAALFPAPTVGQNIQSSESTRVHAEIQKLGAERGKKVEIRLRDKTKIKGYITAVDHDTFAVSDLTAGTSQTISYANVLEARRSGGGSKKPWFIAAGIAAGAIVTWIVVKPAVCDGGAQSRGIC